MSIDKTLQKIKVQIGELSDTMENFVHESIQPSAEDCERLRTQMNDLLELLAVYKYHKSSNEIEPGFNLHAKVSEKAVILEEARETIKAESTPSPQVTETKTETRTEAPLPPPPSPSAKVQPLQIGINDKFRFINELFSQNSSEYNIVLEQLNNLQNWHDTEVYLNSLKSVYGWKDNHEVVKYFYNLTRRRFE